MSRIGRGRRASRSRWDDPSSRFLKPDAAEVMNRKAEAIRQLVPEFQATFSQMRNGLKVNGERVFWKADYMGFDSQVWAAIRGCPGYGLVEEALARADEAAKEINLILANSPRFDSFLGRWMLSPGLWASRDLPRFFESVREAEVIFQERWDDFQVTALRAELMDSSNWRGYRKEGQS
jgi:hypothetical protein